ncbi:MAG TPA: endonuclease V [Archaeoglobus profundus]|nr:endonuclease V [Archaeoglobus profundus]HIP58064.1 endonuclease V [Archaeoglobus profundus]
MDLEKLKRIQEELAKNVVLQDYIKSEEVKFVIGVDQSFIGEKKIVSACVVLTFPDLREFSSNVRVEDVKFPYIPTFLMFREGDPAVNVIKDALKEVDKENTIILVDGSGIAHPRRCGLATYIALKLKIPTIGVTKRKLFGEVTYPKKVMEATPIYDKNEVIGYALKPCKMCNPIFISPGSYITPKTALKIVMKCMKGHKLPEPIRLAHELATKSKSQSLSFFLDF